MELLTHGRQKFPRAALAASSAGLGWRGIAAELRAHPAGDLPPFRPTSWRSRSRWPASAMPS